MPLPISLTPPTDPIIRRALRVLAMVHELHKAGYQRLRIAPGASPSGCYWRCHITHAGNVQRNGWEPLDWQRMVATYTTGQGDHYFDWKDATGKNARQLAQMFVERFPEIAHDGRGIDRLYAGWYVEMLGAAEHGQVPEFFADYPLNLDPGRLPPPPPEVSGETLPEKPALIANDSLRADMLPAPDARWEDIEPFCLSFDGYAVAERLGARPHEIAEQVARDGVCAASMDELRVALFFKQRYYRSNDHLDISSEDLRLVRAILEEIRFRISKDEGPLDASSHAMRAVVRAGLHLIEHGGYGQMMILPYSHANGCWRCEFHLLGRPSCTIFRYTAASGAEYLANHCGGRIPRDASPEQLAEAILKSVPEDTRGACRGPILPEMARWCGMLRTELDRGRIPEAFHEYSTDKSRWNLYEVVSDQEWRPLPTFPVPPGYVSPGDETSPWDLDYEAIWGDKWSDLRQQPMIQFPPERAENVELLWDAAGEYLKAIMNASPDDRRFLFARAVQFALVDLCETPEGQPAASDAGWPDQSNPRATLGLVVEKRPLDSFDLRTKEGRLGLLWNLYDHYQEAGTLVAVNHIWSSLGRPKGKRSEAMAQRFGLPGVGKQALVNVIKRFLQESLYEVEIPDLPERSAYEADSEWNNACLQHFENIHSLIGEVVNRFEAVLDGRDPESSGDTSGGAIIQGPWRMQERYREDL